MKYRPILVDDTLQELTQHGTEDFPVSMDEQPVWQEHCGYISHWHYEIQISLVTKGSVLFRTPSGEFLIKENQGIFFNSACLHEAIPTGDKDSVYICVNFRPQLIYGQSNSLIRRDYVDPVLFSPEMQVIPLIDAPWHKEICRLLRELGETDNAQQYGYEISLTILLLRIWKLIFENNRSIIEAKTSITFAEKQRIKALQHYIHKNYMEKITLADIADSAHICRGECCRIFKRILHITPICYLVNYRIKQSIKLLSTTDLNISEIAHQTGFGSSSYYSECFKKEMKCTPLEYRRQFRRLHEDENPRGENSLQADLFP